MSLKQYTPDQIEELLKNQYVSKCSPKYITYTYECKARAIELSQTPYISCRDIFSTLGFPAYIIASSVPKDSIKAWKRIVMKSGLIGLREGKKGRKKKDVGSGGGIGDVIPITETVEYLKAKIAYLEAENEVFRLIRAGKYK